MLTCSATRARASRFWGGTGFFVDEGSVLLHSVADADGVGGCEASVDFDEELDVVADGFSNCFKFFDGDAFGFDGDEESAVVEWVALECGEALFGVAEGVFDGELGG